jgi:hypothetical protein
MFLESRARPVDRADNFTAKSVKENSTNYENPHYDVSSPEAISVSNVSVSREKCKYMKKFEGEVFWPQYKQQIPYLLEW